jgi:hypothetical protein
MSAELNEIIQVVISKETKNLSRASFGIPLIAGLFAPISGKFTGRVKSYSSLGELSEDFGTGTYIRKMAQAIFAQNPSPAKVLVGRGETTEDWVDALDAIQAADDTWYVLLTADEAGTPIAAADQVAVAGWIETQKKLYITQTTDEDVLDPVSTTDLAAELNASSTTRTAVIYHAAANFQAPTGSSKTEYADGAWVGNCLPFDPGSQTWAYKTLASTTKDTLGTGDRAAALAKKANIYYDVAGQGVTRDGTVASGEYIDIMIGVDWIEARLQEEVFTLLVNRRKIPYSDEGIQLVEGAVRAVLGEATRLGILQADSAQVTVPRFADISSANKLSRNLPDVRFTALLQGAIHTVQINGVVTV